MTASFFLPLQLTPSPVNPGLQAQMKLPTVLVHVAVLSQLSASAAHSSMSTIAGSSYTCMQMSIFLPLQLTPSPVNPGLQAQVKFPTVLVQTALVSQLSVPVAHSLMSIIADDSDRAHDFVILPTSAADSIPSGPRVTGTSEAPHRVGAYGSTVTVVSVSSTFINVYHNDSSKLYMYVAICHSSYHYS